jgi:hypothetical protein
MKEVFKSQEFLVEFVTQKQQTLISRQTTARPGRWHPRMKETKQETSARFQTIDLSVGSTETKN